MKIRGRTRLLALLLAAAMLVELAPVGAVEAVPEASQPEQSTGAVLDDTVQARDDAPEPEVQGELTDLREQNVKHFRLEDGSFTAVTYDYPVHYQDADGRWQNIDNTLQRHTETSVLASTGAQQAEIYEPGTGSLPVQYAASLQAGNGAIFTLADGAVTLFWEPMLPEQPELPGLLQEEAAPAEPAEPADVQPESSETVPEDAEIPEAQPDSAETTEEPAEAAESETLPAEAAEPSEQSETPEPAGTPEEQAGGMEQEPVLEPERAIAAQLAPNDGAAQTDPYARYVPALQSDALVYENVQPGVSLRYETTPVSVKESIVVAQPQTDYRYSFRLQLDGLTPVLQADGSILLQDSDGTAQYGIPAPYMQDANHAVSQEVVYDLEELEAGSWRLTVTADSGWMEDASRAYPVAIDPTIVDRTGGMNGNISTTYVASGADDTIFSEQQFISCGRSEYDGFEEERIYLHVNSLPEVPTNCKVVSAAICLAQSNYSGAQNSSFYILANEISDDTGRNGKTYDAWITGLKWKNRPPHRDAAMDYVKVSSSTVGQYSTWDVTSAATIWYQDEEKNDGITLRCADPTGAYKTAWFMRFGSSSPAYFVVNYRNTVGIESYYTYQTQSIDRAGTAYFGDYSGQLTLALPLVSLQSTVNGFGLTAVYNSANWSSRFTDQPQNGLHTRGYAGLMGGGWKLSVQQTVAELSLTDFNNTTTTYLVYNDEDGTEHYFRKDASTGLYYDEDGLNLQIQKSGSDYTMKERPATTGGGNNTTKACKIFHNGLLTEIRDNNENAIYICYNGNDYSASGTAWKPSGATGQKVTKIVQYMKGATENACQTVATLAYDDSSNQLSTVTDFAGRVTGFVYSSGTFAPYLTGITLPDGTGLTYAYQDNGRMSDAHDGESGYGVRFSYQRFGAGLVLNGAQEYTAAGNGNSWNCYHYSLQKMEYRYHGADHTKETADDIVTRYTFDFAGRTINATNMNTDRSAILGVAASEFHKNSATSGTNNRLTGASSSGGAAPNLLRNSGMELVNPDVSNRALAWTVTYPSNGNVVRSESYTRNNTTIAPHSGKYLSKLYLNNTNNESQTYQTVYLTAGVTYTLSAYVNTCTEDETHFGSGGARLYIQQTEGQNRQTSRLLQGQTSYGIDKGWERLSLVYTAPVSGQYHVGAELINCANVVAAVDDLQLEIGKTQTTASLLQTGSFDLFYSNETHGSSEQWTLGSRTGVVQSVYHHGASALQITGAPDGLGRATQAVPISSSGGTYLLSGWAKADSTANTQSDPDASDAPNKRFFGLIAQIVYSDNTTENHYVPFCDDYSGWQYASGIVAPKKTTSITKIVVAAAYDYNLNTAWFDELSLRPEPVETYKYDKDGKLTAVNSTGNNGDSYTYSGPDLRQATTGVTGTYTYNYDSNHNMTLATTNSQNSLRVTYDGSGNATKSRWFVTGAESGTALETSTTYSADKRHQTATNDANGVSVSYAYNSIGAVSTSTAFAGSGNVDTKYTYHTASGRNKQTYQSGVIAMIYGYTNGLLSSLSRKSFARTASGGAASGSAQWQSYKFTSDAFGNPTGVYVSGSSNSTPGVVSGDIRLASYTYESGVNNGRLHRMTYGNGAWVEYTYDLFDRVTKEVHSDGTEHYYFYDTEDRLTRQCSVKNGTVTGVYTFVYDSLGRLIRSKQTSDGVLHANTVDEGATVQQTQHLYDQENRITRQSWTIQGKTYSESYTYNDSTNSSGTLKDGSIRSIECQPLKKTATFDYDNLKHLGSLEVPGIYKRRYSYKTLSTNRSSNLVSAMSYSANTGSGLSTVYYTYSYDAAGNITSIAENNTTQATYAYDSQGQLITENRGGKTYKYTYDTAGNLLKIEDGSTTTKKP